jgi:hypothetical protein
MVVFSSELLAYYDLTFIILVSTGQGRGIFHSYCVASSLLALSSDSARQFWALE